MATLFSHIGISAIDPVATEKFYTKYFGFVRTRVIPLGDEQIVFLKLDSVYLELFLAKGTSPEAPFTKGGPEYPGIRHLAFQVDDVDAKLAEIGSAVEITLGPMAFDDFIPGWKTVWIRDPDGRIIEISQGYQDQTPLPEPLS